MSPENQANQSGTGVDVGWLSIVFGVVWVLVFQDIWQLAVPMIAVMLIGSLWFHLAQRRDRIKFDYTQSPHQHHRRVKMSRLPRERTGRQVFRPTPR